MENYENARNKTKKKIKDAFWQLYEIKDISKITINQITQLANVHRATFYLYYHDIYEVLEEIENEIIESLRDLEIVVQANEDGIVHFVDTLFEEYHKYRKYLHLILVQNREPQFSDQYYKTFLSHFPNLFSFGKYSEKVNNVNEMTVKGLVVILVYFADNQILDAKETAWLLKGFLYDGVLDTILKLNGNPLLNIHLKEKK